MKKKIIAFLLDNCEIIVPEASTFFVRANVGTNDMRIMRRIMENRRTAVRAGIYDDALWAGMRNLAYYGNHDFGHTAPVWEDIFALGLGGMKKRILERTGEALNPHFVEAETMVFEAAERFCLRAAEEAARCGKTQMAEGIRNLATQPPKNIFEGFQMTLLYYNLQQYFEGTDVRTMGRLDHLLQPFYELESDKGYVNELAHQYMLEIDALKVSANMPFAIAGTDGQGRSQVNDMSYVFLRAYADTMLPNTKLHVLCNDDMPRDFLEEAMVCVKHGGNSLVFINNQLVVDGLVKLGLDRDDAAGYSIVGCYEASGSGEIPCSCSGRVSLPKVLEATLHGGRDALNGEMLGLELPVDFASFEELYEAFDRNAQDFIRKSMEMTNRYEARHSMLHSAPFFSATMISCVEKGGDVYCDYTARYNNTSVNIIGLGTAIDSLCAIRKLVYEDKRLTLQELISILDNNWEGQEVLRGIIWNKFPKYGTGNKIVDTLAAETVHRISGYVNGVPNAKGGVYRLGIMSIDWRRTWGERTAASADGRKNGDTLSQNASATFGKDKEGPTGHILSVAALDSVDAVNGVILDMDLHSSAVRGKNGTHVLMATLDTFMKSGGQTIHYNVLDTDTLRDAQLHPENYPNLQVRLCGWNVLFTHMSKKAQDEFIRRSEMQAG